MDCGATIRVLVLLCCFVHLSGCAFFVDEESISNQPTALSLAVAETAKKQIGAPYVYGGCSPKGFDCSGLVQFCYGAHGIQLPRTADDQEEMGREIPPSRVRAGDLLVFSPGFFSTHTGIYIGRGEFVHAPGRGRRVEKCQLAARHWQSMLSSVRRVIED